MADNDRNTADEPRGESGRKPATEARKTKEYVLKDGAEIGVVHEGEFRYLRGENKQTVKLTEEQAAAFGDKLAGEADEATQQERNMKDAQTISVGEQTGGAATIVEAAALAGKAEGISSDDQDHGSPQPESGGTPAGQPTADVTKVGGPSEAGKATAKAAKETDGATGGASASPNKAPAAGAATAKS
jgi:hypothetical protein